MKRIAAVLLVVAIALAPAGCASGMVPAGPLAPELKKVVDDYVRMIDAYEPGTDEAGKRWANTRRKTATEMLDLVELAAKGAKP